MAGVVIAAASSFLAHPVEMLCYSSVITSKSFFIPIVVLQLLNYWYALSG
jgi:hypothetical protein